MNYNIRKYRLIREMTQQELADKSGCSRQYINMLENNEVSNISTSLLINIAKALDVKVDALLIL